MAPRVWELRDNLAAYDATYIALSELLAAPLHTTDAKLAGAPDNHALIELICTDQQENRMRTPSKSSDETKVMHDRASR